MIYPFPAPTQERDVINGQLFQTDECSVTQKARALVIFQVRVSHVLSKHFQHSQMRGYCNESVFLVSKSSALELSAATALCCWNVLKFDLKKVLQQLKLN